MNKRPSLATVYERREPETREIKMELEPAIKRWVFILCGLAAAIFLSKQELFTGVFPLGLACAGSWILADLPGGILVLIASFISLQEIKGGVFIPRGLFFLPVFIGAFYSQRSQHRKKPLLFSLLSSFLILTFFYWKWWRTVLGIEVIEALIAGVLAKLLAPGLGFVFIVVKNKEFPDRTGEKLSFSLGLLILVAYIVLGQTVIIRSGEFSLRLHILFAFMVILLLGNKPRIGLMSVMGIAFSLCELFFGAALPWHMPLIAGGSLLAGLGRKKGKIGLILGALLSMILSAVIWWGAEGLLEALIQGALALTIFLLLPRKTYYYLQRFLPLTSAEITLEKKKNLLVEEASSHFSNLAELFFEISQVFYPRAQEKATAKKEIISYFQDVVAKVCNHCPKYDFCWKEQFYPTYREFFDLITLAEIRGEIGFYDLKGRLEKECLNKDSLIKGINLKIEKEKTGYYWRRRFRESQFFLTQQLTGIASLMREMADKIPFNFSFDYELEEKLKVAFERMGLGNLEIIIQETGIKNRPHIIVEKQSCNEALEECRCIIAPLVSEILGCRFTVGKQQCEVGNCCFHLIPEKRYKMESAVAKLPKAGNEISGDTHGIFDLEAGLMLGLLSDGMGVGEEAAALSESTVSLVERMLGAGLEKRFALKIINSLLLLGNPGEKFATLDLLMFNQFTGEIELFKIGSAPTYIKKGQEVQVIRSTSLPIGIVDKVEPEYYRDFLEDDDLIVMVSDGVIENKKTNEDWILKTLKKLEIGGVEPFSQYLLELAKIETAGEIKDDMSIMVLKIEDLRCID